MFLSRDIVKARLCCENSEHLCSLQLKTSQKLEMISENEVTEANSSATFQLNAFFLQDKVSLKVHARKYVDLPKIINIKNNIAITKKQGFPIILNNPGLEIPLKAKKDFSKLTIQLSLLSDPGVSACTAEVDVQDTSSRPPQAESNSTKISLDCIRDAATFLSLPQETRDILARGGDDTVRVNAANISADTICDRCHVFKSVCSCRKQCEVCLEWFEFDGDCRCSQEYVTALKARIANTLTDESDVITLEDQSDISAIIDEKIDAFNLVPPEVTPTVDLSHISDPKVRELVENLVSAHDKSFSTHRFDVGHFLGFEAELDCCL